MLHFRHFSKMNKLTSLAFFIHHVVIPYLSGLSEVPQHQSRIWEHKTVYSTFDAISQAPNSRAANCFFPLADLCFLPFAPLSHKDPYIPSCKGTCHQSAPHLCCCMGSLPPGETWLGACFWIHKVSDLWTSHSINPSLQQMNSPSQPSTVSTNLLQVPYNLEERSECRRTAPVLVPPVSNLQVDSIPLIRTFWVQQDTHIFTNPIIHFPKHISPVWLQGNIRKSY